MSFIKECCNTPPVQAKYTPVGETFKLKDDLDCYVVGDKASKNAILYVYDVFTNHPNAYQGCDILSKAGYRVIMPDFLRNDPPTNEMLGDGNKFMDYVKRKGTWEILESDFKLAKKYLQDNGAENIFLIGFCWGAKMVMAASAHDPSYKGGACVHPSLLVAEDFEKANAPMIVLPSQNERDFTEDFKLIQAKPFGKLCYMQRFDDMIHGWCAARGEWQDSAVAARANEAFTIVASGFKSILSSSCCPKSHH